MRLVKLAYLAETLYAESYGRRLSDADWFSWKHGPYSKRVINSVRALDRADVGHEERTILGKTANYYMRGPQFVPPELPAPVSQLIDDLLAIHGREDTQAIVSAVYRSPLFRRTRAGRSIDMDGWVSAMNRVRGSTEVRSNLQAALNSPASGFANAGELLEFLDELRSSRGER